MLVVGNFSRQPHASVPWGSLQSNPEDWIDSEYWPKTVLACDPSHMRLKYAKELYNFWRHRQDNNNIPIKFRKAISDDEAVSAYRPKRKRDVKSESDEAEPSTAKFKLLRLDDTDDVEMDQMESEDCILKKRDKAERKKLKKMQKKKKHSVTVEVPNVPR